MADLGKRQGRSGQVNPDQPWPPPLALCTLSAARGGIICQAAVPVMCERGERRKDAV